MEETAQNFEKRFFINRSQIFIALPKFYVTHLIYEILSKSLVPSVYPPYDFIVQGPTNFYVVFLIL
jgi:hypothetical protein